MTVRVCSRLRTVGSPAAAGRGKAGSESPVMSHVSCVRISHHVRGLILHPHSFYHRDQTPPAYPRNCERPLQCLLYIENDALPLRTRPRDYLRPPTPSRHRRPRSSEVRSSPTRRSSRNRRTGRDAVRRLYRGYQVLRVRRRLFRSSRGPRQTTLSVGGPPCPMCNTLQH